MKLKLNYIASIQTGIFAKMVSEGDIVYLQAKHFDENGQLNSTLQPDLLSDDSNKKHLLKHGDILFAAKGTKNFATWFENKNQPAVASTSFFVVRLQNDFKHKILPAFLVWYINHPNSQKILKSKAIGTSIVSISKAVLQDLEIFIPSIQKQETILKITALCIKEKKLIQQIEILKEKQIHQEIFKVLN